MLPTIRDAATSSWQVGYLSASQISRVNRFFGSEPAGDIAKLCSFFDGFLRRSMDDGDGQRVFTHPVGVTLESACAT